MDIQNEVLLGIASFIGGNAIGFAMIKSFLREEAKKAVKDDLNAIRKETENLENDDKALHKRINHIEDNYVSCKYCDMQHANLKMTLENIERKIDILIEKK